MTDAAKRHGVSLDAALTLLGALARGNGRQAQFTPMYRPRQLVDLAYVAWRGLVDEPELTDEAAALLRDRFSFFEYPNSHMLAYLVPGEHEATEPGKRRYNWVWYRNAAEHRLTELLIDADGRQHASSIPPGLLSAASETDLREAAARHLPPAYRALVAATRAPFLQTIQDLSVRRMAVGRIALVGDAAFIPRPHTAASTAKAAGNALALVDALKRETDIPAALRAWEPDQIQYGLHLRRQGKLCRKAPRGKPGRRAHLARRARARERTASTVHADVPSTTTC